MLCMSGHVDLTDSANRSLILLDRSRSCNANLNIESISVPINGDSGESFEFASSRSRQQLLRNGDSYLGSIKCNVPEGFGKYVWSNGIVYEGEWRCGVRHGFGKLKWPSGASYEGEFSGGYLHGKGIYVSASKLTYKGRFKLNRKHGLGYQIFPNGDVFEGSWIKGLPEGPGKYIWSNGNIFMGNMRAGQMTGKGSFTWTNGDTFEGGWLNGLMHGFGVYTWTDGGCYIGTWTHGLKDGKGSFYPRGSRLPMVQQRYVNALRTRGLLPDFKKQNHSHAYNFFSKDMRNVINFERESSAAYSSGNLYKNFFGQEEFCHRKIPLERRWSLEVSFEKAIGQEKYEDTQECALHGENTEFRSIVPRILEREYVQGVLISEIVINNICLLRSKRREKKFNKEVKRPGEIIIKGHRSYDLMLSLQLGIRYTVGKITPIQRRELHASDYGPKASFWMHFPKDGSQLTPTHQSEDFKWKDYCPMVFRNLRELFKIDAADYMMSICGNDALRELSSPGKSGSIFFLSQDDRFMIKTLRKSEVKVLLKMLPDYHQHVRTHENTLITKFFGLHRVKPSSGQKFRFVVMGNMFCTELRIHRRFDLKGSSLGRSTSKVEIDENSTLKDLDLNYHFYLEPSWREALLMQIENDSKFLERQRIMDYSLLLGVHYRAPQHLRYQQGSSDVQGVLSENDSIEDESFLQGLILVPRRTADEGDIIVGPHIRGSRLRASSAGYEEVDLMLPGTTARLQIQLGVNLPARAEQIPDKDDNQAYQQVYDVVLYLGIIDILQEYNICKKVEHAYKALQFDSFSISAVDPTFYSSRFLNFIKKVFPPNSNML